MTKVLGRLGVGAAVLAIIAYLGAMGFMYVKQRDFQYSPAGEMVTLAAAGLSAAEPVALPTGGDGAMVNGWYQPAQAGRPVILYYKGNAGSFSEEHERFATWVGEGYGFLAFDYRGFPLSEGQISQDNILEDALAAYDWLDQRGQPIVIWGRSLGSGPATYVASRREADALFLETPFLSAVDVAAERYGFLPVGWLMSDQFPVKDWILQVDEPVFVAHGTADTTIGVSHGERVHALAPHAAGLWIVPGAGHSDLWKAGIWERARGFFEMAESARPPPA